MIKKQALSVLLSFFVTAASYASSITQTQPPVTKHSPTNNHAHQTAKAILQAGKHQNLSGQVFFKEDTHNHTQGLTITVDIMGLAPNSTHAFHVHSIGDCSAADFSSAGGHFNPDNAPHGNPNSDIQHHHLGDLPNLTADSKGTVHVTFFAPALSLLPKNNANIVGRSVIVHGDPDDYISQPAGNAGPRIACGIIKAI